MDLHVTSPEKIRLTVREDGQQTLTVGTVSMGLELSNANRERLRMNAAAAERLVIGQATGGTRDYEKLYHKPSINGRELVGNIDLGAVCKTTAEWSQLITYVPDLGEVIVYTDHGIRADGTPVPAVKIGDGNAFAVDLPFVGQDITEAIMAVLDDHIHNSEIHVSPEDRERWDNKLNCVVSGENLTLNRD